MHARFRRSPLKLGAVSLLVLLLGSSLSGCQDSSRTFAGFTFGGGGNTFSCEPASIIVQGSRYELRAGAPGADTSLLLEGAGPVVLGEEAVLDAARVRVPDHEGEATLVSGSLVQQTQDDGIAHGSFDLKVKGADGREFQVVGSYTASLEDAPASAASPRP